MPALPSRRRHSTGLAMQAPQTSRHVRLLAEQLSTNENEIGVGGSLHDVTGTTAPDMPHSAPARAQEHSCPEPADAVRSPAALLDRKSRRIDGEKSRHPQISPHSSSGLGSPRYPGIVAAAAHSPPPPPTRNGIACQLETSCHLCGTPSVSQQSLPWARALMSMATSDRSQTRAA
jgi:hypothetical protein